MRIKNDDIVLCYIAVYDHQQLFLLQSAKIENFNILSFTSES